MIGDRERSDRVFHAVGSGPTRTAVLTVRVALPDWATDEDAINEYLRWVEDDAAAAAQGTTVVWEDTGEQLPIEQDDEDDDEEESDGNG
jgi:hypothetical protein